MIARRDLALLQIDLKVSTWPRRKLAIGLPLLVTPLLIRSVLVNEKEPVGLKHCVELVPAESRPRI